MRFRFLILLFLMFNMGFGQTNIDVIRASNYYSKAIESFDNGNYQEAAGYLKESEINLKGKTNDDLVFLKIMTQYKLKDYDSAYNLLLQYFNGDFNRNRLFFKNVINYRQKHALKYDQYLTEQFIDIENKYNLVKGIDRKLSPEAIAMRIITEKKDLIPFMRSYTNTKNITLSFRRKLDENGEQTFRTQTYYFDVDTKLISKSIILNGKKDRTEFTVICNYDEELSINKEAFYYTFSHKGCKASRLELGWNDEVGGQVEKGLYELSSKKFCSKKKEVNSVDFTQEEKEFLAKEDNFEKLKSALEKNGITLK